jgi:hypothetical protein
VRSSGQTSAATVVPTRSRATSQNSGPEGIKPSPQESWGETGQALADAPMSLLAGTGHYSDAVLAPWIKDGVGEGYHARSPTNLERGAGHV